LLWEVIILHIKLQKPKLRCRVIIKLAEAVARLTGNYTGDIATFDQIHKHANGMSDAIVAGIVKQFPERFSTPVSTTSTTTVPNVS
jgi:hypothetical protein